MIVMKFGGTSVKTSTAMKAVLEIVRVSSNGKVLVVLSACGGITDKLLAVARAAGNRDISSLTTQLNEITTHHTNLIKEMFADDSIQKIVIGETQSLIQDLQTYCEGISLLGECTNRSLDYIASFGERLSTTIFNHYLLVSGVKSIFHDARETMRTNSTHTSATVDTSSLRFLAQKNIQPLFSSYDVVVTQGFIGSTPDKVTTTLGRGGSDYSAALFGAALDADEIQIWTDVNGVLSADPRQVPEARTLPEITFSEMRELAYYGAKVLHPETIKPALDKNIPVRILNTFDAANQGTLVVDNAKSNAGTIRSVTVLKSCAMLKAFANDQKSSEAYLEMIVHTARKSHAEIFLSFANESSATVVVRNSSRNVFQSLNLSLQEVDIVCACGADLSSGKQFGKFITAIESVNPLAVLLGTSRTSIFALVDPKYSNDSVKAVHSIIH